MLLSATFFTLIREKYTFKNIDQNLHNLTLKLEIATTKIEQRE